MLAQQIVNGILLGSMYALLAISYTLVLGVLNLLNLAQGEILTASALIAYTLLCHSGNIALALAGAVVAGVILSIIIEYVCFRLPRGDTQVVTTIAMGMILQNVYTKLWGSESLKFPSLPMNWRVQLGSVTLNAAQILLIALTVILVVGLAYLIERTRFGRQMRAMAGNPRAAQVSGVSLRLTTIRTFALSGLVAGVTGVMAGMVFTSITAFIGGNVGEKAMVAMVIGGAGSAFGAGVAGLLLGVLEIFSVTKLGAEYREIIIFPLLLLFLWLRPSGLFHRGVVDRV